MIGEIRRRIKILFQRDRRSSRGVQNEGALRQTQNIEPVIESDIRDDAALTAAKLGGKEKVQYEVNLLKKSVQIKSRNAFEKLAYRIFSNHLPMLPDYRRSYEQSGIPITYDAYFSTSIFLSFTTTIPTFVLSFIIERALLHSALVGLLLVSSGVLSGVVFGISFVVCVFYPLFRASTNKSKLENSLAYSFGVVGVLAAAGMSLERLFERIAASESNPVLAVLAERFLRNVRIFGLDSEKALKEVAEHSPSQLFSKMLQSISVSYRTSCSIQYLVMFDSSRLLQENNDRLRKTFGSLSVLAELYITLVVVGPIIFIVMMAIFGMLPEGGLPNPALIINLIVFLAIPIFSVIFLLLLDSVVAKA